MNLLELLKQNGLKATPQRLSVLKCLSKHTHPNIDEIYKMIKQENPTISLATIYKNIAALINENLVIEINSSGQKTRYDIYEKEHIHIVCQNCGEISDIFQEEAKMKEYQSFLEKQVGTELSALSIVATIPHCKKCS